MYKLLLMVVLALAQGLAMCPALHAQTVKDTAWGIFDLTSDDSLTASGTHLEAPILPTDPAWQNPDVTGVAIRAQWDSIQHNPPTGASSDYDWSYLDLAVSLAEAQNQNDPQNPKTISIQVTPGFQSPSWIYSPVPGGPFQTGAQAFTVGSGTSKAQDMPAPWDPVFQYYWQKFVTALGQRYDSNPVVSYVAAEGPGRAAEIYLCDSSTTDGNQDVQELNADGGVAIWDQAAEAIAGFYAAAFPTTPFLYQTGVPIPGDSQDLGSVVNYSSASADNDNPYGPPNYAGPYSTFGARFGIKSDGLIPGYSSNGYGAVEIPYLSPTNPVGFQMSLAWDPSKSGQDPTALEDSLNRGLQFNPHFIEVYSINLRGAPRGDPSAIHAAQQQMLNLKQVIESVQLITTSVLSEVGGGYQAVVTVTNPGTGTAPFVQLTSAALGTAAGATIPISLGNIAGGRSMVTTLTFPSSAGVAGARVVEKLTGTYSGGTFGGSFRAVLP